MTRMVLVALIAVFTGITVVNAQESPSFHVGPNSPSSPPPKWQTWELPPPNLDTPTPTPTPTIVVATPLSDSEIRPLLLDDTTVIPVATEITTASSNETSPAVFVTVTTNTTQTPSPPSPSPSPSLSPPPSPSPSLSPSTSPSPSPPPPPSPSPPPTATTITPAPTAYVPPPIPVAAKDSPTFRLMPPIVCDDKVSKTIQAIYTKNRELFDTCATESKYQIFPFSGTRPTPVQIRAIATTKACTVLFMACVGANLPECDTAGISLKAVTETLLKVTMDVEHGKAAPDTERFHDLHIWRRNSNLAKAAGVPNGNDSALYAEFARDLPAASAKQNVQVKNDLSIVHTEPVAQDYGFGSDVGTMLEVSGVVHANDDAVGDGNDSRGVPDRGAVTNTTVTPLSGAASLRLRGGHAIAASLGVLTVIALVI